MERVIVNQSAVIDGSVNPPAVYLSNEAVTVIRQASREIPYRRRCDPPKRRSCPPCQGQSSCRCICCALIAAAVIFLFG